MPLTIASSGDSRRDKMNLEWYNQTIRAILLAHPSPHPPGNKPAQAVEPFWGLFSLNSEVTLSDYPRFSAAAIEEPNHDAQFLFTDPSELFLKDNPSEDHANSFVILQEKPLETGLGYRIVLFGPTWALVDNETGSGPCVTWDVANKKLIRATSGRGLMLWENPKAGSPSYILLGGGGASHKTDLKATVQTDHTGLGSFTVNNLIGINGPVPEDIKDAPLEVIGVQAGWVYKVGMTVKLHWNQHEKQWEPYTVDCPTEI